MFGISIAEFFVIIVVGVLVIPARNWPDVARFMARVIKFIRGIIWKITDATEKIKTQIDLEKPIDDLIKTTTDDILADFSKPRKRLVTNKKRRGAKNEKNDNDATFCRTAPPYLMDVCNVFDCADFWVVYIASCSRFFNIATNKCLARWCDVIFGDHRWIYDTNVVGIFGCACYYYTGRTVAYMGICCPGVKEK